MTRQIDESFARGPIPDAESQVLTVGTASAEANGTGAGATGWSGSPLGQRIFRPRTLLSFVVAIGIVAFVFSRLNVNVGAVADEMAHANPWYLLVAFAAYYGSFGVRAARWRSLLESAKVLQRDATEPTLPTLTVIFVLSWFANSIVPAKLGDAYRGFLLKRKAKTPFTGALGTIFAERLVDLVALAVVLIVSAFVVFGRHIPDRLSSWMELAAVLGVALVLAVVFAIRFRHHLRALVPHRVRDHYVRIEEGALGSFGRLPTLIALTGVIWALEGVRLYFVSLSVGVELTAASALFVALLASLLTVIPFTPAGLGFVEVGVVGTLALMGTAQQTAASVALLDRVVAYWSVILVGAILYLVTRWDWR